MTRRAPQHSVLALLLTSVLTLVGACHAQTVAPAAGKIGVRNPTFTRTGPDPRVPPPEWEMSPGTRVAETAYLANTYALTTAADQLMARQRLDFAVVAGQRLEVYLEARGEGGAQLGLAVLVELADGRQASLRPLWDQPLTATYARYAGTLTVPAQAKRLVGLELHRTGRQGTVWCREVNLFEASSWQEIKDGRTLYDRYCSPRGEPFVSGDGVRWAQPLPGGPVSVLLLLDLRYARLSVELAERFDVRVDTICRSSYTGEFFAWEGASRINARLAGNERPYDVIVVAEPLTSEPLAQALEKNVALGSGLVVVHDATTPTSQRLLASLLPEPQPLVGGAPDLARHVPWQYLPLVRDGGRALQSVGVGTHGRGRVVALGYGGRTRGFMPDGLRLVEDSSELPRWWEYVYSLLGKSVLWAAQREMPASIAEVRLDAASGEAQAVVVGRQSFTGTLSLSWPELDAALPPADARLPVTLRGGEPTSLAFRVPAALSRCHGVHLVNAVLRDADGRTVDWATATLVVAGSLTIARQHPLGRDWYTGGGSPSGAVTVTNQAAARAALTVTSTLTDVYGRGVWSDTQAVRVEAHGTAQVPLTPSLQRALTAYHRLRVTVSDARGPLDAREWPLLLPDQLRRALEDFQFGASANYYVGLPTDDTLGAYLRAVGVTFSSEGGPFEVAPRLDMPWHYMSLGGSLMHNPNPESHQRENCFSNPEIVSRIVANATAVYPIVRRNGAVFHTLADEAELVKDGVVETCYCPHCVAGFRTWALAAYHSVEAANAEWGTAFTSWNEVSLPTADEARSRGNFALWADFRAYMEDTLIALLRAVQEGVQRQDPAALVGYANPFGLNPFSGADNAKMARAETALAKYMRPDVMKEYVTLNPTAPAHTYYGYGGDPTWCGWYPWWFALNGGDFLVWWDPFGSSHPVLGLFDCFGGQTDRSLATLASVPDLLNGVGKILHEFPPAGERAAILYSQTSMHVAWAESGMKLGDAPWGEKGMYEWAETPPLHSFKLYYRSTENAKALLKELGLQPEFMTPDDLVASKLRGHRLLLIPYAGALSEAVLASLTEFVQSGGTVVADLRTAAYSGHGKPLASRPAFERLFGVRRSAPGLNAGGSVLTCSGALAAVPSAEGLDQPAGREPLELVTGQALARHPDGTPAAIVNSLGKGQAVYLNFVPGNGPASTALLRQVLKRAGVAGELTVTKGQDPALGYECFQYARGPLRYVGLLRDLPPAQAGDRMSWHGHQFRHGTTEPETVALRLPAPCEVYDVRAGKHLGRVGTVPLRFGPAEAKLLGLLPYRVTGVQVTGIQAQYAPGDTVSFRVAVAVDRGQTGDHVLRLAVYNPAGKLIQPYSRNVLAPGGHYEGVIPLALNQGPGAWRLQVTDVTTKVSATATFAVGAAPGSK